LARKTAGAGGGHAEHQAGDAPFAVAILQGVRDEKVAYVYVFDHYSGDSVGAAAI